MMSENFCLLNYLRNNTSLPAFWLECLRYELDQQVYFYGQQFKNPREGRYFKLKFKDALKDLISSIRLLNFFSLKKSGVKPLIISNAYFSVNRELENLGYSVSFPPWSRCSKINSLRLAWQIRKIRKYFDRNLYIQLNKPKFLMELEKLKTLLAAFYKQNNVAALFVPNDLGFFEQLSIQIFKELKRPSYIFLHGLPGRYNNLDDNLADYLLVWGDQIKANYVQAGIAAQKILVCGHPYYKNLPGSDLRFGLDNILVISKSMNGGQFRDQVRLSDRGNLILYLYQVQQALQQLGVKEVRLRLHPSENWDWYSGFLDNNFFKCDKLDLSASLKQAGLVLGPTSTVMLEAVYYGVNYTVFEPCLADKQDLINFPLVNPFDGSDKRIPVAHDTKQLVAILQQKKKMDTAFWRDYIKQPFNLKDCIFRF